MCDLTPLVPFRIVVSLLGTTVLAGCHPPARGVVPAPDASVARARTDGELPPITVVTVDRAEYDRIISAHRGKIVFVDCWATWCLPCMEQFPRTVALSRNNDPDQVAVVSVSMDQPENKVAVLAFLEEHEARFDNLLSVYGIGETGAVEFDYDGALPHYKIYDRGGIVVHAGNDVQEAEEVVERLLNSQP